MVCFRHTIVNTLHESDDDDDDDDNNNNNINNNNNNNVLVNYVFLHTQQPNG